MPVLQEEEVMCDESGEDDEQEEEREADKADADSSKEEEDKPSKSTTRKRSRGQLDDEEMTSGAIPGKKSKKAHGVKMNLDTTQVGDSSSSSTSEPTQKKASKNSKVCIQSASTNIVYGHLILCKIFTQDKVTITDVEVGTGKLAKPGKKVSLCCFYVHVHSCAAR